MRKLLFVFLIAFSRFAAASPEIKGNPDEIERYLNGIPKIVTINEQADTLVSSNKARIKLHVKTEAQVLADALRKNSTIRSAIRKKLLGLGIKKTDINESKFSSTPEYGFFGDTPKSYTVNNTLSVLVDSEEKMIAVASISDENKNIRYLSSKPEIVDKDEVYKELSKKALQRVKEKAAQYQEQLGVKLIPVSFNENTVGSMARDTLEYRGSVKETRLSTVSKVSKQALLETSFGETKLSFIATVQYKVYPPE